MSYVTLKRATRKPEDNTGEARSVVERMLSDIRSGGETAVKRYAHDLDKWSGEIVVPPEEIERRAAAVPADIKRDIEHATRNRTRLCYRATTINSGLRAGDRAGPVCWPKSSYPAMLPAAMCRPDAMHISRPPTCRSQRQKQRA